MLVGALEQQRDLQRRQVEHEAIAVARMAKDPNDPRLRQGDPAPVSRPERAWHRAGKAVRGGREEQDRPPDAG
jgi:hypothetical protein